MEDNNTIIEKYLKTLTEQEKQALEIAKIQLESSFSIEKSIGFLNFKKNFNDVDVHQS